MSLQKSINNFTKKWAANMKATAPVRTGRLKNSIKPLPGPEPAVEMVGYGQFVNDGHKTVSGTKVPPNPQPDGFIQPSFDKTLDNSEDMLLEGIFDELDNAFDKTFE